MGETKIKCKCLCGNTLYISYDRKNNCLIMGSEKNARKGFEHFCGVQVDVSEIIKLLK